MAQPKALGLDGDFYEEAQKLKADEDFKTQANDRIQKLEFALDEINTDLSQAFAIQSSNKTEMLIKFENLMQSTISSLKDFRREFGDLTTMVQKHGDKICKLHDRQIQLIDEERLNEKISHLNTETIKLLAVQDAMRHDFNEAIQRLSADFSARMKAVKEEILAIPSDLPTLKKEIDSNIALVEINCQNAVLRSGNNEKQLMLVERKIDNLYQLVKQLQIANQEAK